jgi:hypothetical protein
VEYENLKGNINKTITKHEHFKVKERDANEMK